MIEGDVPPRFRVRLEPQGWSFYAAVDVPLLTSARVANVVLPSSCRNGTCRACICRVIDGAVRYGIEWPGLSAEEKRDGWILPCVAMPASDLVIQTPKAIKLGEAG